MGGEWGPPRHSSYGQIHGVYWGFGDLFEGFMDLQDMRELRRIRREDELVIKKAREHEERWMNELIYQQSEAIWQSEQWFQPFPGDQGSSLTFSPFLTLLATTWTRWAPVTVSYIPHSSLTLHCILYFRGVIDYKCLLGGISFSLGGNICASLLSPLLIVEILWLLMGILGVIWLWLGLYFEDYV